MKNDDVSVKFNQDQIHILILENSINFVLHSVILFHFMIIQPDMVIISYPLNYRFLPIIFSKFKLKDFISLSEIFNVSMYRSGKKIQNWVHVDDDFYHFVKILQVLRNRCDMIFELCQGHPTAEV